MPAAVRRQLDQERDSILQLMQECIKETQAQLGNESGNIQEQIETSEVKMTGRIAQVAAEQAQTAARAVAAGTEESLTAVRRGLRLSYVLGAFALAAAVCGAAAVYLLLS